VDPSADGASPGIVRGAVILTAALLAGCEAALPPPRPPAPAPLLESPPDLVDARWGSFPSARFGVVLPLPAGDEWTIRDRGDPWLTATHEGTSSSVLVRLWREDEVINRARCEARARSWRALPEPSAAEIVEERAP
jgi:hypothetical protein